MKPLLLPVIILLGLLSPSIAAPSRTLPRGQHRTTFEKWLFHQPKTSFHHVPDDEHPGLLYAGRFKDLVAIVRVFLENGLVTKERVEVILPPHRFDSEAIKIIARFFTEFMGGEAGGLEVLQALDSLHGTIVRSGRRQTSDQFHDARISLRLNNAPEPTAEDLDNPSWGTLYWIGEVSWPTAKPRGGKAARPR